MSNISDLYNSDKPAIMQTSISNAKKKIMIIKKQKMKVIF